MRQTTAPSALQESEETFRLLFSHNPLPMWLADVTTREFLEVNNAAVAHYGYSRTEFLSMRLDGILPSDEIPRLMERLATLAHSTDESPRRAGTWKNRLKDGRETAGEFFSHPRSSPGRRAALVAALDRPGPPRTRASLAGSPEGPTTLHGMARPRTAGG